MNCERKNWMREWGSMAFVEKQKCGKVGKLEHVEMIKFSLLELLSAAAVHSIVI